MTRAGLARVAVAVAAVAAVAVDAGGALTGCAGGGPALPAVEGAAGQPPTIRVPPGSPAPGVRIRVLTTGSGPVTRPGQVVVTNAEIRDWRGDRHLLGTYDTEQPTTISLDGAHVSPTWARALLGRPAGSRILLVSPATEGFGPAGRPPAGVPPSDTLIDVFDVIGGYAPGQQVPGPMRAAPGGLPRVTAGPGREPRIVPPRGPAPSTLVTAPLIAGAGPRVRPGATVVLQYVGARWNDGAPFDSSYARGGPNGFDLRTGAVVPGWTQGLAGQRVGSRIMIVVPRDMERGFVVTPGGVAAPKDSANVYVIDILGVS